MRRHTLRAPHTRGTYMIEALLLLVCVLIVVAITMSAFAFASSTSQQAARTEHAIMLAQEQAECFAADPTSLPRTQQQGDYTILCDLRQQVNAAGTLYTVHIAISYDDAELYTLETSRYLSAREVVR